MMVIVCRTLDPDPVFSKWLDDTDTAIYKSFDIRKIYKTFNPDWDYTKGWDPNMDIIRIHIWLFRIRIRNACAWKGGLGWTTSCHLSRLNIPGSTYTFSFHTPTLLPACQSFPTEPGPLSIFVENFARFGVARSAKGLKNRWDVLSLFEALIAFVDI